jgi:hypothetical protein
VRLQALTEQQTSRLAEATLNNLHSEKIKYQALLIDSLKLNDDESKIRKDYQKLEGRKVYRSNYASNYIVYLMWQSLQSPSK